MKANHCNLLYFDSRKLENALILQWVIGTVSVQAWPNSQKRSKCYLTLGFDTRFLWSSNVFFKSIGKITKTEKIDFSVLVSTLVIAAPNETKSCKWWCFLHISKCCTENPVNEIYALVCWRCMWHVCWPQQCSQIVVRKLPACLKAIMWHKQTRGLRVSPGAARSRNTTAPAGESSVGRSCGFCRTQHGLCK